MTGLWLISYLALWLLVLLLVVLTSALIHQIALISVAVRQSSRDLNELSAIIEIMNSDRANLEIGGVAPEFLGLDVRGQEVHFGGSKSGDQALLFIAPGSRLCQQVVKHLSVFPDGTIFIQGKVTEANKRRLVLQDDEHMITTVLDYSPEARVWKGEVTSWDAIEVDDFIFSRGLPVDGKVVAIKIWANIENLYATVSKTQDDGLFIEVLSNKYKGQELKVKVDHKTLFNEKEDSSGLSRLITNQQIQVLGVMQRDGILKATKIWY